jgi:hypothetical protein
MRLAMLRIKVSDARVLDPGVRSIEKATKRVELDRGRSRSGETVPTSGGPAERAMR